MPKQHRERQGKFVASEENLSSLSGWNPEFVAGNTLKVQEKAKDQRWFNSKTIARQGAGVFLGQHEGTNTELYETGKNGKKVK